MKQPEAIYTRAALQPASCDFGRYLRELRLRANLTQAELAERSGVSERLVSDYERAVLHRPRRETVRMLASGLRLEELDREMFARAARGYAPVGDGISSTVIQPRTMLPELPGSLIGRDGEIAAIRRLLRDPQSRLVTLVGPAGVGKTRLAIDLARQLAPGFQRGAIFVDLTTVHRSDQLLPTIAQAVEIPPGPANPLLDAVASYLRNRSTLLVLDNFEHLLSAAPDLAEIVDICEKCRFLVTSRASLRLRRERLFPIEPLDLPDSDAFPDRTRLAEVPSVALFIDRAKSVDPKFELTDDNAGSIAEIAVRLDGLPLAIELAVARLPLLSVRSLCQRLKLRLPLLTLGPRDLPVRQRAMRAAIAWSYELLAPDLQKLFRGISIFSGGFTLDAVESMSTGFTAPSEEPKPSDRISALDGLSCLIDWSLVRSTASIDGQRRFMLLETIREFGVEQMHAHGEHESLCRAHLNWCVELAELAEAKSKSFEQPEWLELIDAERDNMRQALQRALDSGFVVAAERLCASLYEFWIHRGFTEEARNWLERTVAMGSRSPGSHHARVILGLATVASQQGDYARASIGRDALCRFRAARDRVGASVALRVLGRVAMDQGDWETAEPMLQESLTIAREVGDVCNTARALLSLGLGSYDQGNYEQAKSYYEEGLLLARAQGLRKCTARGLNNLALACIYSGEVERARNLQQEALEEWSLLGYRTGAAHSFENLALVFVRQDALMRAATLFGAAHNIRQEIGLPGRLVDQQQNERQLDELRRALGEAPYWRAYQTGRMLSSDAALAYALE